MTEVQNKISLQEAMDQLTVGEVQAIERHYDRSLEGGKLSGTDLTAGLAWAMERRRLLGQEGRPDWAQIEQWPLKQLNDYFATEEIEIDSAEPDTDEGKDDSLAAK